MTISRYFDPSAFDEGRWSSIAGSDLPAIAVLGYVCPHEIWTPDDPTIAALLVAVTQDLSRLWGTVAATAVIADDDHPRYRVRPPRSMVDSLPPELGIVESSWTQVRMRDSDGISHVLGAGSLDFVSADPVFVAAAMREGGLNALYLHSRDRSISTGSLLVDGAWEYADCEEQLGQRIRVLQFTGAALVVSVNISDDDFRRIDVFCEPSTAISLLALTGEREDEILG